jgi:spermidine/putrescine transport system permease protein
VKGFDRPRWLHLVAFCVYSFLFAPVVMVVVYSFNSRQSLSEFGEPSLAWYRTFFDDETLKSSLRSSIEIGLMTTVGATILGTALAIGLARSRTRVGRSGNALLVLPLVTPELALAVSLLLLFGELGIPTSRFTIVAAHVTFFVALVTVIVRGRLLTMDDDGEEAAMDLGATRLGSVWLVTLPALWPAIVASALFVFGLSFDNFLLSFFTSGTTEQTLPVRVYASIRNQVRPTINAIGTLMLAITLSLMVLGAVVLRLGRRERSGAQVDLRQPAAVPVDSFV